MHHSAESVTSDNDQRVFHCGPYIDRVPTMNCRFLRYAFLTLLACLPPWIEVLAKILACLEHFQCNYSSFSTRSHDFAMTSLLRNFCVRMEISNQCKGRRYWVLNVEYSLWGKSRAWYELASALSQYLLLDLRTCTTLPQLCMMGMMGSTISKVRQSCFLIAFSCLG